MVGVWRHADARVRGMKRVQVEPHLSVTGACSARVGADQAEDRRRVPLRADPRAAARGRRASGSTSPSSPSARLRPIWSGRTATTCASGDRQAAGLGRARRRPRGRYDAPAIDQALEGRYAVDAVEIGPDGDVLADGRLDRRDRHSAGSSSTCAPYSPEWAEAICDVPAATIRRIAHEFIDHARVGETIEIEGSACRSGRSR